MFLSNTSSVVELYTGRLVSACTVTVKQSGYFKDVAEFERKELIKVRIHHALRTVSTALTALTIVAVSMSIIDVELHYLARGKMIPLQKLRNYGIACHYTWSPLVVKQNFSLPTQKLFQGSFVIRISPNSTGARVGLWNSRWFTLA